MTGGDRIVLDTTVLSNYARSGSVDWLAETVPVPLTVHAVRQELERARDEGYEFVEPALRQLDPVDAAPADPTDRISVVPLGGLPRNDAPESVEALDRGEAHALYCAWPEGVLATDDRDARELARKRSVFVTGSVGLLVDGITRGELDIPTADDWLETWREHGYYSPVDSVTELLDNGASE